jgi:uncharacterized SAM-binding protein YcdF (DUF218 family)
MNNDKIDELAERLYDYGKLRQVLQPVDAIVALGNMDIRIAEKAAELWHKGLAPMVVASGGVGRLTPQTWNSSEAATFAEVMYGAGVPHEVVVIEDKSTNLPENIRFSVNALKTGSKPAHRLILVTLPFAERRILALCKKQFSDIEVSMASPDVSYVEFPNEFISKEDTLNLIAGELDRLDKFPAKGFSVPEEVPQAVLDATVSLMEEGFDKYRVA